ncbi:LOW QUALITY PROTEIN: hypothetical protein V1478_011139 [Vespula squamosa]|uniref:Uncharacterized protein n=1 Tax=Vespula squamosa TaxID=30214 RepID=A0ABD2AHD4_VESSQ
MSYISVSDRKPIPLRLLDNIRKYITNDLICHYRNSSFRLGMDETETFYLNLPPFDHHSMIRINSTIDASTSTKIYRPTQDSDIGQIVLEEVLYFLGKKENESNDSENNDYRVIIQKRKVCRKGICRENDNENVSADKFSNTINLSTTDYGNSKSEEEYLTKKERRKTLSKFFQCHKIVWRDSER